PARLERARARPLARGPRRGLLPVRARPRPVRAHAPGPGRLARAGAGCYGRVVTGPAEQEERPQPEVAPLLIESRGSLDLDVDSRRFVDPAPPVLPSDSRDERPLDLDVDSARYVDPPRREPAEPPIPIIDVDS